MLQTHSWIYVHMSILRISACLFMYIWVYSARSLMMNIYIWVPVLAVAELRGLSIGIILPSWSYTCTIYILVASSESALQCIWRLCSFGQVIGKFLLLYDSQGFGVFLGEGGWFLAQVVLPLSTGIVYFIMKCMYWTKLGGGSSPFVPVHSGCLHHAADRRQGLYVDDTFQRILD